MCASCRASRIPPGCAAQPTHSISSAWARCSTCRSTPSRTRPRNARAIRHTPARRNRGRQAEKVAIDLRLNRGGNNTLIVPLIRALIQSERIDHKDRLFAIIGPATFSAAQMLAGALEKYTNVTFVGEPSGSKGNAYGDSRKITLPNSGMTVRASIYYWQDWHPQDKRDAIVPGIPAPLTFDAYRDNVDPALEAIALIKTSP